MTVALWFGLVALGSAIAWYLLAVQPRKRLEAALARPFPDSWEAHLSRWPLYRRLPPALRQELQHKVQRFIHQKQFVGCEGLQVTDAMRVLVAAGACLLILNRPSTFYRPLRWIYIYPGEFRSRQPERDEAGVVSRPAGTLLGVSWHNGRVVLAWDSVQASFANADDGFNVVLHEFAHQLDQEDGVADGAPLLEEISSYERWSRVLGREFEELQAALEAGEEPLLDDYAATHPAEFFAVATELFYERPRDMALEYPSLFAELAAYYRVDPRDWR